MPNSMSVHPDSSSGPPAHRREGVKKMITTTSTWATGAAILALTGSVLWAAPSDATTGIDTATTASAPVSRSHYPSQRPNPLDPPGCWDADGVWHQDCWGPGQWGPGQYGPGQWGPGQYAPGQWGPGMGPGMMGPGSGPWGPGMMGPGQWGPGMGPGVMGPGSGPWGPGMMGPGPGPWGPGMMGPDPWDY